MIVGSMSAVHHHVGDLLHALAAEQAHEVVLEREVELGRAWVALTAGAAAQLVVDTAGSGARCR